ncbi:UvrD-helicase domain-containing protein [Legionella hackeliae]|uniref:DNA 3'-5' helicase n=1 Tax=Legionella hackeliae TaxID=449 RepID=A0A0A8UUW2_LEGHA|nr:UvrD-helicase domain-containing protein [Legionella hackeliae]KTD15327.1 UvrD/REP helicase [Legionella hackeliae]CEK11306.1 ATP-dependent DNA helicase (UvrD/Rep helicase) [Legionella hackeliae]STX48075.1 UvrD/REP helicase [Legionella hackeliae]
MLKDSPQRIKATDPRNSFIVQAPAGSGKTEILTQRYLRLLSVVSSPEQIVALTFTRKAANEMRERILLALKQAAEGKLPSSSHQQQTFYYAKDALKRSQQLNWQLLKQSSRLRIMTIDALCQSICQAIPLLDKQIPYAQITDNAQTHYQTAARACLAHALATNELHHPLKQLLKHLDNRQDKLLTLFSDLLASRDQWLSALYIAREQNQASFENMLRIIEQHELMRFKRSIPKEFQTQLCSLARMLASVENNPSSPRYPLRDWHNYEELNRQLVTSLSTLLLTSQNSLRQSFDHHVGLKRGVCDDTLYDELKTASKELMTSLSAESEFLETLLRVKDLPSPHYDPEQWQVLQSLFTLLPLLVGHLHLVFTENNEVDFTGISQQALVALGHEEQPTDLALYLDNTIHHLLVDEFQDTSIQQFELLTKLLHGWQSGDGKTLFIVGDPMQSIYRFRQAEVGLFLKAKQEGIGSVKLESLELCCNFRSTPTIVNWVNQQFQTIFPKLDDIESGAISFHHAVTVLPENEASVIEAYQFPNRTKEAEAIVSCAIKELETHPEEDIAILVRSRNQLMEITRLLREQQIPFQGVEIECLSQLPHLRDLWTLTQVLLMPANRLAWLALLRSPFCGLPLDELLLIANWDKKKSIYEALERINEFPLQDEHRTRLQFVYQTIKNALNYRHQESLVDWIALTFKQLQGQHILNAQEQDDLEQFWQLLERFTFKGQYPNLEQFTIEFNKLYSQRTISSRLQVMTIHKSKGLEFDSVILPGLSSKAQNYDQPLFRWLKLPSSEKNDLLLVSPIKAAHREECLVYNYLARYDAEKENYELQRLLYVAVTRAKKRLYLFDNREKDTKNTFRNLLRNQDFVSYQTELPEEQLPTTLPLRSYLPNRFYHQLPVFNGQEERATLMTYPSNARQIGIVAHELLQWICNNHPLTLEQVPWNLVVNRFKSVGFDEKELNEACENLKQQITRLFEEPIGNWLIQVHEEEANEYALFVTEETPMTRIIDRTFIHEGQRWVIDFKTGSDEEGTQEEHRLQVNEYARLLAHQSDHPIRCGVYYLAKGTWLEWSYSEKLTSAAIPNN